MKKSIFTEKDNSFLINIGFYAWKLSEFHCKSSARSSGRHSTSTKTRFEKITTVSKKHVSFINMGLRVERKNFYFWQYFVRTVVKILFCVSRSLICFFLNSFYPLILFEIRARIAETFYAKLWARLLNLHSTSLDKQSEEKPTFGKNIVLHTFLWLGERGKYFD